MIGIEGRRGTGKSTLAAALRATFAVGVFDVGVLFRLVASCFRGHISSAVDEAEALIDGGEVAIDVFRNLPLAATLVTRRGNTMHEELWSEAVDAVLRDIASDADAVAFVHRQMVRHNHTSRLIVVGRRVAADFCEPGAMVFRLVADADVRRARKTSQLSTAKVVVPAALDRTDPVLAHPNDRRVVEIRTDDADRISTLAAIRDLIVSSTDWGRLRAD